MKLCFALPRASTRSRQNNGFRHEKNKPTTSEQVNQLSEQLDEARSEHQFVLACLQYATWIFFGDVDFKDIRWETALLENNSSACVKTVTEEQQISILRAQLAEIPSATIILSTIRVINSNLLKRPLSTAFVEPDPELLFRIFTPNSHTAHDCALGFRCSSGVLCPPDLKAKSLVDCSCLNAKSFITHCEKSLPSEFISLSESPAGLMNFIHAKWHLDLPDEVRIAVLNVRVLRKLHVLFDRTTTVEKHLGLRRVLFVTASHWIAHRWIPAEAIDGYLTLSQFRQTCYFTGIVSHGSDMITESSQLAARLSHHDLFPTRARQSVDPRYDSAGTLSGKS